MNTKPLIQTGCEGPWEWYGVDIEFGTWRNCPRIPSRLIGTDYAFNNHPEQIERREFWLNGKKHPTCRDCWESEDAGGMTYSSVLGWNRWIKNPTIRYKAPFLFEIKFSNLCNLRCTTCNGKWSSTWEDERPPGFPKISLEQQEILKEKVFEYIKQNYNDLVGFNLMGGEIVLHKGFYELFELILDAPKNATKKEISFSTNGYYPESYKNTFETHIEKLLDNGHEIFARFSVDGIGDRGTYQRAGLDWKKFENNFITFIDRFKGYERTRFRANVALNIINLCCLDEIAEFLTENNMHVYKKIQDTNNNNTEGHIVEPHYNFVSGPEMFYMKSYGTKLKHAISTIEKQNFYDYTKYKNHVIDLSDSYSNEPVNEKAVTELQDYIALHDARYNKNFLETFPENEYLFT